MNTEIRELLKDEEYQKFLFSLESPEKMSEELKNKGIDLSPEEIGRIAKLIEKKKKGELTDDELEEVSGGFIVVY